MSASKSGSINKGGVNVSTAGTLIVAGRSDRLSVLVQNLSTGAVFWVGTSTAIVPSVATGTTPKLTAGAGISYDDYNGDIYGKAASGTVRAAYQEVVN